MKLSIDRSALLGSLSHIQNVVERRTTIPILSNVKLTAVTEGILHLTATDMELSIAAQENCTVEEAGTTTVAAHLLFDIVRKLADGSQLALIQPADVNEMTVTSGRSEFTLPTLPSDQFPAMEAESLDVTFTMPSADLAKIIDKTRFAISLEETRYYLNGIHVHAQLNGATSMLRGVATDGHRLARVEVPLPDGASDVPPIILPRKTVGEIRKLIDEQGGDVEVSVSANRIQLMIGTTLLISRLIDGTFPDYERVIPKDNDKKALVEAKAFATAVDRVATISTERARAVKLSLEKGKLSISAASSEAGRAVEEIDIDYDSDAFEIGFNARYILDMMAEVEGSQTELNLSSPASPTIVRDPEDGATLHVLMPMRV